MLNDPAMRRFRDNYTTAMSCLILFTAIACGGGGTSLDGPVLCGSQQCDSNEVCTFIHAGIDAGSPGNYYCEAVPSGCEVYDCTGDACTGCIQELCSPTHTLEVMGRMVKCQGQ